MGAEATKIPLIFGVTGHRDIPPEDSNRIEAEIGAHFRRYKARYPQTPIALLTSLAEGADRVAASAAEKEGVEIIGVLPMPRGEYEQDFTDPQSRSSFGNWLDRTSPPIVLSTETPSQPDAEKRAALYEGAGVYVALQSHILIAVWDGHETDESGAPPKVGGTAAIVAFRNRGNLGQDRPLPLFCRSDATTLDAHEPGPILQVVTRRTGSVRLPLVVTNLPAEDSAQQLFKHLNGFNADVEKLGTSQRAEIEKSAVYLLPQAEADTHPELAKMRLQFATADSFAVLFRDRVQRMLLVLSFFALIAFVSFELFAHIRPSVDMLLIYFGVLVVPWFVYLLILKPLDWQGKYLDYRALAEALRVQLFWRIAGIPLNAADFYLRRQTGGLAWIRHAARACSVTPFAPHFRGDIPLVRRCWTRDQRDYFMKSIAHERKALKRWNMTLRAAYGAGISIAVAVMAWLIIGFIADGLTFKLAIVAMGLAPAVAAVIGFILEHRAYQTHIRQYGLMRDLYERAEIALDSENDSMRQRVILEEMGREALAENGDWVVMHRERPIAPPR